ncbi:hypothetical protein D3C81_2000980 [compost metagenome]
MPCRYGHFHYFMLVINRNLPLLQGQLKNIRHRRSLQGPGIHHTLLQLGKGKPQGIEEVHGLPDAKLLQHLQRKPRRFPVILAG